MAESFLFDIATKLLGKVGSIALQETLLAYGMKNEFEKIQQTALDIKAVLLDAEEQQEKNHQVSAWLQKLKDVFYDVDDLLDEVECEALRQQVVNRGSIIRKVRHFFSCSNSLVFRWRMGHKIKNIRKRLDEMSAEKSKFNLTVLVLDRRVVQSDRSLQTLMVHNCMGLEKLPRDFGDLISLGYLEVTTRLKCLPANGIGRLNSLRHLLIAYCVNLESLFDDEMQCLTKLRLLIVENCEHLVSLSRRAWRYLSALETLRFYNCENLNLTDDREDEDIEIGLNSLRTLTIELLPMLVALPGWLQGAANTLKYIVIEDCHNFTSLPEWIEDLKSLQKLRISGCPKLTYLPDGMRRLITLREIHISECPELIVRCEPKTGEDWHKIAHVPDIYLNGFKI
ncbi:hypothetical protein F0562_015435 [Nyssa sinensis]|uniref:Uncharacterized protein n=1 Tax=Nyssa sinensis TaxID=561372 RepID=A0A5J4ZLJ1_9ASTE|nr:hypothetical protein F0562_015435 [Nyssa sinensis]